MGGYPRKRSSKPKPWLDPMSTIMPAVKLRLPLIGKDVIKEALMDALGVDTIEESRRL